MCLLLVNRLLKKRFFICTFRTNLRILSLPVQRPKISSWWLQGSAKQAACQSCICNRRQQWKKALLFTSTNSWNNQAKTFPDSDLRFLVKHLPLLSVQTVPGTTRSHSLSPYSTRSIINGDDNDNYRYFKGKHWQRDTLGIAVGITLGSWYPVGYFLWTDFCKRMLQHGTEMQFFLLYQFYWSWMKQILWIFWLTSCTQQWH